MRRQLVTLRAFVSAATGPNEAAVDEDTQASGQRCNVELARRGQLPQAAMNEAIEPRENGVLGLLQAGRLEKAIVDGSYLARKPPQRRARAGFSLLR